MVQTKSLNRTIREHIRGCILSFIDGKTTINFPLGNIKKNKYGTIDKEGLIDIFNELEVSEGSKPRFNEIKNRCKKEGLLD